jgi:hypothetical protein
MKSKTDIMIRKYSALAVFIHPDCPSSVRSGVPFVLRKPVRFPGGFEKNSACPLPGGYFDGLMASCNLFISKIDIFLTNSIPV